MQIQDHTFLITGAGSGLGGGTADLLASKGANVILVDVNEEAGLQRKAEIGDRAIFVKADVSSESESKAAVAAAGEHFGALHGVVNCAGVVLGRKTLSRRGAHDLESFERIIRINLIGTFNMLRLGAELMANNEPDVEGERGIIINTASVAAYDGQIGQVAYSASKGGIVAMTLPVARDLSSIGIRVMAIAPGIFETPMVSGMSDELQASLAAQIPFPSRLGRPSEYAALVQHIIENVMLNGEVIRLDGAIRMGPR